MGEGWCLSEARRALAGRHAEIKELAVDLLTTHHYSPRVPLLARLNQRILSHSPASAPLRNSLYSAGYLPRSNAPALTVPSLVSVLLDIQYVTALAPPHKLLTRRVCLYGSSARHGRAALRTVRPVRRYMHIHTRRATRFGCPQFFSYGCLQNYSFVKKCRSLVDMQLSCA